jgi:signal peptidase II
MLKSFTQSGARWLWLTLLIIALDRLTKMMVLHFIKLHHIIHLTSWYNLTLAYNRGAAFSMLSNAQGWQSLLFSGIAIIVSCVLVYWLFKLSRRDWWESIGLSLILGGAIGNLLDRFIYGHVVDFIQWHYNDFYWPVFNIADTAICMGSTMLIAHSFFSKMAKKKLICR